MNDFDLTGQFSGWNVAQDYLGSPFGFYKVSWGAAGGAISMARGGSFGSGYDKGTTAYDAVGTVATLGVGGGVRGAGIIARSQAVSKSANSILRKVGLSDIRIGGNHIFSLHAPHNVAKRLSGKDLHQGYWHVHTGVDRTARHVFRFWQRFRG